MLLLEDYPQYNTNNLKILQKGRSAFIKVSAKNYVTPTIDQKIDRRTVKMLLPRCQLSLSQNN